jgi:hypothetical protein
MVFDGKKFVPDSRKACYGVFWFFFVLYRGRACVKIFSYFCCFGLSCHNPILGYSLKITFFFKIKIKKIK